MSEAIAVGSLGFVEKIQSELGFKAAHREFGKGKWDKSNIGIELRGQNRNWFGPGDGDKFIR